MAPGADDPTLLWQDAAYAPTCRACLRVVDSWFPKSTAPVGMSLLAELVADAVVERSSTCVPGEHLEATRRAIRKALLDSGFRSNTHVIDDVLAVWSDDAHQALDPEEMGTSAVAAIERAMSGESSEAPSRQPTIGWNTWVIDV